MFTFLKRLSRPTSCTRPAPAFRPRLEFLEDRCLPSGGALDPTFGPGGTVTTGTGVFSDSLAYAVTTYPNAGTANDGKIVAAGVVITKRQDIGLVRYNLDGMLDTSFGSGGLVTTSVSNTGDGAGDVKVQPDGKVVVAGWTGGSGSDFALVRYNPNGSLDTSFGGRGKGKVITDLNRSADFGWRLARQPDGKFVVAGTSNGDLALVRYNADGSSDTSFGVGGKLTTHFSLSAAVSPLGGMDMALTPGTGKIVVAVQLDQGPVM